MKIIHEDCDPKLAEDRQLPYTAYLVEYVKDGGSHYDVAMANKQSDMFDYYWDKYKEGLIKWTQSKGTLAPGRWNENMIQKQPPKTERTKKKNHKPDDKEEKK